MLVGEYMVSAFLEPMTLGRTFRDWPLHVTVVPWFQLAEGGVAEFAAHLQDALDGQEQLPAVIGTQHRLGSARVKLLANDETWQPIHDLVLAVVHERAKLTARRAFVGQFYKPHISVRRGTDLVEGDEYLVSELFLVEKNTDNREIVGVVTLKEAQT